MTIIKFPHVRHYAKPAQDWSEVVQTFLSDLRVNGREESTIAEHAYELKRFNAWLQEHSLEWYDIAKSQIDMYARTREGKSFSYRTSLLTTMRVFYQWCQDQEHIVVSPAAHLKTPIRPRPVPRALTLEHIRSLLRYFDAFDQQEQTRKSQYRDRALLLTSLYTGMRPKELANICWWWCDMVAGSITIPISKMQHGRTILMHPDLKPVLESWGVQQGKKCVMTNRSLA